MRWGTQERHEVHERPMGLGFVRDNGPSLVDNRPLYGPHLVPENEYQALMECDFGEDPKMSATEREADWALFQQKLESAGLTEREMIVVDCVVFGQMSLSKAGEVLARSEGTNKPYSRQHIYRIRNSAYAKLRAVFEQNGEDE